MLSAWIWGSFLGRQHQRPCWRWDQPKSYPMCNVLSVYNSLLHDLDSYIIPYDDIHLYSHFFHLWIWFHQHGWIFWHEIFEENAKNSLQSYHEMGLTNHKYWWCLFWLTFGLIHVAKNLKHILDYFLWFVHLYFFHFSSTHYIKAH